MMKYKCDWPEAQRRLTALWNRERLDRPCIAVCAPCEVENPTLLSPPANEEERWLDPKFRVARVRQDLESVWWGGEAVPSSLLMANWFVSLGGAPRFSSGTIWFETREVDFGQPSPFRHDAESIWMEKYRTLLLAVCAEAGADRFLVGKPGGLPANDLLPMHMGTEDFLFALLDEPEWMAKAILVGAQDQLEATRQLQAVMRAQGHEYWYGNAGWMAFWAPEPFFSTQSDVSCMLSPPLFDQFVLPELEVLGAEHGALWYHLDGGNARQHILNLQ